MCVHLVYLVGACSPGTAWLSAVTPRPHCLLPALRVPRALESGSTSQPFPLLALSLSPCAHPWFIATNQKRCALGQEPLCSQEPLQRARGPPRPSVHSPCPHHHPSGPYSPACTGLLQFLPPSPRCGDHLQERIREVCYSVSKGRPPNHNWTQADGSPAMRGPTLAWPAQQQLTGVGPCVTDQPESGCQAPRGGAQTDLTAGLELGAGDPHSAGGSS